MPSERSTYRKIQEVLDVAKSLRASEAAELQQKIASRRHPIFFTRQYDAERDDVVHRVSDRVIKETIRTAQALGLLGPTGTLTDLGRKALHRARFDKVVAGQIRSLFRQNNIDLTELNKSIVGGLQGTPPMLPTSRRLWEAGGGGLPRGAFTRMLTLLSHCGAARSSQTKIYLEIRLR